MTDIRLMFRGLAEDPGLVSAVMQDPAAYLGSLLEPETLAATLASLAARWRGPGSAAGPARLKGQAEPRSLPSADRSVALVGVVSLAAVTAAVITVGAVSLVALERDGRG